MTSGCFDHSAIWSRTKICLRNPSSVVCPSAIKSGKTLIMAVIVVVPFLSSSRRVAEFRGGRRVEPGDADQVVDLDPFRHGMLSPRAGAVSDRRNASQGTETIAVVDERLGAGG